MPIAPCRCGPPPLRAATADRSALSSPPPSCTWASSCAWIARACSESPVASAASATDRPQAAPGQARRRPVVEGDLSLIDAELPQQIRGHGRAGQPAPEVRPLGTVPDRPPPCHRLTPPRSGRYRPGPGPAGAPGTRPARRGPRRPGKRTGRSPGRSASSWCGRSGRSTPHWRSPRRTRRPRTAGPGTRRPAGVPPPTARPRSARRLPSPAPAPATAAARSSAGPR